MTVETKTTIQISDIATIEFTCSDCKSVTVYPLRVAQTPPITCHCKAGQWMTVGGDAYRAITELIRLMQQFAKTENEPFVMRFGIKNAIVSRDSGDGT